MGKRILREPEVLNRLGIGRTKFDADYIKTGRARWVRLGLRAKGMPEHEVEALIDEAIAERDAKPPAPPTVPRSATNKKRKKNCRVASRSEEAAP